MNRTYYVFLDFECACGEGITFNEIIQIGAVKTDKYGNIVDKFNRYVKPIHEPILTSYCKKLTKIKQSDIDNAENFEEIADEFEKWHEDVSHIFVWGKDADMWGQNCLLFDRENVTYNLFIDYQYVLKHQFSIKRVQSLSKITQSVGLDDIYSHNALNDAIALFNYIKHINPSFDTFFLMKRRMYNFYYELSIEPNKNYINIIYKTRHDVFGILHEENLHVHLTNLEKEGHKNTRKLKRFDKEPYVFINESDKELFDNIMNRFYYKTI